MKKILLITSAIIILIASFAAKSFLFPLLSKEGQGEVKDVQAAATRTGLVGYWTMNSGDVNSTTMYDRSGQNNHGTLNGTTATTGIIKQARSFNGTSDYINVLDNSSLRMATTLTLAAWVKRTQFGVDVIAEKGGDWNYPVDGGQPNYGWGLHNINSNMFYFWWRGAWKGVAGVSDFNWHHYVATAVEGDTNPTLYIDGVQRTIAYSSGVATILLDETSTRDLHIGAQVSTFSYYSKNIIDDFRIYNRVLSAQEVANLYSSAKTNFTNTPSRASSTPSAGNQLIGYWNMDSNDVNGSVLYDRSGQNNHGTMTGTTAAAGKIKQARNFNGSSDSIAIANESNFDLSIYTISFWAKTLAVPPTGSWNTMLAKGDAGPYHFSTMAAPASCPTLGGQLGFGLYNGSFVNICSGIVPVVGRWYHVVVTANGTTARMYVDLVDVGNIPEGTLTQNNYAVVIGTNNETGGRFWNGPIDDVRIYNYALSAQEVANLYNAAKTTHTNTSNRNGLVGWWNMDNESINSTTMYDRSGQNNHGTMTGTTAAVGKINQARNFNGSSDSIAIANESNFDLSIYTISFWAKTLAVPPTGSWNTMLAKGDAGPYHFSTMAAPASCPTLGGQLGFGLYNGSFVNICSGIVPVVGRWYHVVATANGTTARMYVDSVDVGNIPEGTLTQNNYAVVIGTNNETGGRFWNGPIDDARIYNYAMSAQEVANLYNAAKVSHH